MKIGWIFLLLVATVTATRLCEPKCPSNFSESVTSIAFSSTDLSPGEEICQLVSQFRNENGLNSLSYSISLEYVASTHYSNLITASHNYFNQTCNMHSWYPIPSKGISFCCYPTGTCMRNKARTLTADWTSPYTPVQFTAVENAAYQQTSGLVPASPNDFVEQWKASPGHRAAMLFGDLKSCGASLDYTSETNFFGSKTDAVSLLWMGRDNDLNPSSLPIPEIPATVISSTTPSPTPATQNPTQYPTPPTFAPTPRPTTEAACDVLEQSCWEQCGRPLIFPFREKCTTNYDRSISSCISPPGCNCVIPESLKTTSPYLESPDTCTQAVCNVDWQSPLVARGNLKWCTACGYNCDGFQQDCINNNGFCKSDSACGSLRMCKRWQEDQCNNGVVADYCPTPTPTLFPTSHPTPQPTRFPTPNPTPQPTPQPTPNPTRQPTPQPTVPPGTPSPAPTPLPTPIPTFEPTPTPEPTTPVPTPPIPTPEPTIPTPAPTPSPTPEDTGLSIGGVIAGFVILVFLVLVMGVTIVVIVVFFRKKLSNFLVISEDVPPELSDVEAPPTQFNEVFGGYLDDDAELSDDDDRRLLIQQGRFKKTGQRITRKKIAKMENQIELKNLDDE